MDFSYSPEQQEIFELAARILADRATHQRLREIERSGQERFDPELWSAFAEAGLLGIAVPEAFGGSGLGFIEVCGVIEQIARRTAPIPYVESVVLGAMPLSRFGSEPQRRAHLPDLVAGRRILTAALHEEGGDPEQPQTLARPADSGWELSGEKFCVPAAQLAHLILVPARAPDGSTLLAWVDPGAPGVRIDPLLTTSGQPEGHVLLEGVRIGEDDILCAPDMGREALKWILNRALPAQCAFALGICSEALRLTASYTKERKQFGAPIASFQAVSHRAADAYVDTEAIRLTAWQAAWRLANELPADAEVAIAKYWAAEGGQRVVHAAQHLHGGIGVDRDFPLHRYFLHARHLELALGGATAQLRRLGAWVAEHEAADSTA